MSGIALLIIDMQQGLFSHHLPDDYAAVIQRLQDLINRARAAKQPVFFVCHEAPDTALAYQSAGWALVEGLSLQASDELVRKTTPDAFLGTELLQQLQQRNIGKLVVGGYASEFCVDTTVRSAAARGFAVDLAADSHTTHDKNHATAAQIRVHHNATLAAIRSFGVPIRALPAHAIDFSA